MSPAEIRMLMTQYGNITLGEALERLGGGPATESPCGLCHVMTDVEFLEESTDWPVCLLCPECRTEVREDDDDPCDGEQLEANRSPL